MASSPLQRLFQRLWRRPGFRRLFYNGLGLAFRRRNDWQMMNCGYLPPPGEPAPAAPPAAPLPSSWEAERLSYALYARLVGDTALAGRDVLEIGAGRGGGARFLHQCYAPRRMVATDYAAQTTRWCRRHFAAPGLEFVTADATALPFAAASFDGIVAVEVTHCIPDKTRFLAEAARVLRPGGRLHIADFFYVRPDAMHALAKFEAALDAVTRMPSAGATDDHCVEPASFRMLVVEDLGAGVAAAIRTDSQRRGEDIARSVPRWLQPLARSFASTTESSTYRGLQDGRVRYLRYVLDRR